MSDSIAAMFSFALLTKEVASILRSLPIPLLLLASDRCLIEQPLPPLHILPHIHLSL
jgi:hypothetical protein